MNDTKDGLTVAEIAEMLGVSKAIVYRVVRDWTPVQDGWPKLYDLADVERYRDKRERQRLINTVTLNFDDVTYAKLQAIATESGLPLAAVVREMVLKGLEK